MRTPPRREGARLKSNKTHYAILFGHLFNVGPSTTDELVVATGLHHQTIRDMMRCFVEHGAAHISAWEHDSGGRASVAVWSIGPGKNAPRLKTLTPAERQERYRARKLLQRIELARAAIMKASKHDVPDEVSA